MAQTKDENKRVAIRDAVIVDVVENGLDKAPVSLIAKRAGVSTGTVYVYYPNKDQMLQSIYLEIKILLHETMMEAYHSGSDSAERIRLMWFAMFNFMLKNPDFTAFHEAMVPSKLMDSELQRTVRGMASEIHTLLQSAIDDGTLKTMPMDCLVSLLIAPAASLAGRMTIQNTNDTDNPEYVFQAIWDGISSRS